MAVRLDAVTDTLTRTTGLPGITSFTLMGWFQMAANTGGFQSFLAYGTSTAGSGNFYSLTTNGGNLTFVAYNGATNSTATGTITVGAWMHLALTCAGTGANQLLAYQNGALFITFNGGTNPTSQKLYWGGNNQSPNEWMNGRLAALKVYSAVLSAGEIQTEMRQYLPARLANLTSWMPLMLHTDLQDYGSGAFHGTAGGTLTTEDGPPIPWSFRQPVMPLVRTAMAPAGKAPLLFHRPLRLWRKAS